MKDVVHCSSEMKVIYDIDIDIDEGQQQDYQNSASLTQARARGRKDMQSNLAALCPLTTLSVETTLLMLYRNHQRTKTIVNISWGYFWS